MTKTINLTLKVWRQGGPKKKGRFETYRAQNISTDMSFLEMIDVVNEQLALDGKEPIAFDHDCREGICGMCGAVINGRPHGPMKGTTLCQLHMRHFANGDVIAIEPFRAMAFKVVKDLVVDRSALDRIMEKGGYNLRQYRRRAGRQCPSRRPDYGRTVHGCSTVHRLRRLCGCVPERFSHALFKRQGIPIFSVTY